MPAFKNIQCPRSSVIGMLCTSFWAPSRAIHTIRCCQRPESFCLILHGTGCRLGFVVDFEEHVDLGGSQFYESILERFTLRMFTTECGNPGIRKSMFTLFSIFCSWLEPSWLTTNCPDLSCTFSTMGSLLSSDERVWFYSFRQRVAPISLKRQFQREKNLHRPPGNRTFFFHLARFWCELRQRVAPICDDFGLELVGSIGNF